MKNMNSQVASNNVMVQNKLKNANASSEPSTKGSLQDGGPQQNMNLDRTGSESVRGVDGPNSDMNCYPPNSGGQPTISGENFSKMNDMSGVQMSSYGGGGYMRGNFNMPDHQQHGGANMTNSAGGGGDFPQQNAQYNQYGQQGMRPNYPGNSSVPRGPPMPGRSGMGAAGSMGMMPPNYNPSQQHRPFMSGPSIQQQGGPTPTLNQLLQNPNSSPRYQGGYNEYPMNQPKGEPDAMTGGNQNYGPQGGWNQQRPMNPYQQHGGSQAFRNQGSVYDASRRPMPGYPQHQGMFPNQQQFPQNSQRYPMGQPRMGQPSSQQGLPTSQQLSPSPNADKIRSGGGDSRQAPSMGKPPDKSGNGSSNQQQPPPSSSQEAASSGCVSSDDLNSDTNSTGTVSRPTPTPTPTSTPGPQHAPNQSGAPQRPVSSPAGSASSRSNTPASVTGGNPPSSPMPPRPPSNQMEGQQGRLQSPMASQQGYPMQPPQSMMMPPPMGPGQMGYPPGPNKMGPNMMAGGPMANYNSQYSSQPQANFRGGPSMMYHQQNAFNGPTSMPSNQYAGYPASNMNRNMNSMNYGGHYPSGATPNSVGNSQFSNNYNMPPSGSPGHGGPPSVPSGMGAPPGHMPGGSSGNQCVMNQPESEQNVQSNVNTSSSQPSGMQSPGPKGAQAAAHAAMMAAANQSAVKTPYSGSSRSRSPSGGSSSQSQGARSQTPPSSQQALSPLSSPVQQQPQQPQQQPQQQQQQPPQQPQPQPQQQQQQQQQQQPGSQPPQVPSHPGQQLGQHHPRLPHLPQQSHMGASHTGQPHHPGMPGMGIGPSGPPAHPHHRMYMPSNYPSPQVNHMNYGMNHMNSQMLPNNSGLNSMPPHNNNMDSMGPGPPPYGHGMGSGPMGGRYEMSGTNEMTTTHGTGMSGGCVSVTQNMMPGSASAIPPNSMPPSTMPMNTICDMNNGIPPNAMAPPANHMAGPQSMGGHVMGPQGMNTMGPGMVPDLHPGMMPGMKPSISSTQQDGNTSDVDVKPSLSSTIAGDTSTTVTQSITTPLTNAMESKAPSCVSTTRVMGPPPPRSSIPPSQIDSSSQDSHSSSQDSDNDKVKVKNEIKQENSSPGTSMHDELENISSPSWPGTPKPDTRSGDKSEKSVFNDVFQKQMEFSSEPERKAFLERLFLFMEERGSAITQNPTISKQAIDLYKLYSLVKERGGMVDVTKNKKWRDVSGALNLGTSSSAGFTLRKNYAKFIFPLECKIDRGDVDPIPILASLETPSKKESKKTQQSAPPNQQQSMSDPFRIGSGQPPFSAFGQNARHPQMTGNSDMHGPMMPPNVSMMPNSMPYDQGNMMSGGSNMMGNNMMPANSSANMAAGNSVTSNMPPSNQNMNVSNQMGMMGPSTQPTATSGPSRSLSNNDSVSVQNPFADAPSPMSSQYQGSNTGQQMPPYSSSMQQQANTSMSSSYGSFMNRSFQGTPNQPTSFSETGRLSSQNSSGSSDSFPSASENFNTSQQVTSVTSSGQSYSQQQQFGNRMGTNMGVQSFGQQPPSQSQSQQSHMPVGDSQQSQQSLDRSETPQVRQPTPQPTSGKPAPPQLHSTDSNSSAGSVSVRPPSQPSSHVNQEMQQPPVYPGGYGSSQPLQPTPSSSQEHLGPMLQQQASNAPHTNQLHQGCYPNQPPPGPVYPARPYPQDRAYPGYHASATTGPYPASKPMPGDHYPGPQSYGPQKPYPDMAQRDGYISSGGYTQPGSYDRGSLPGSQYGMYGSPCAPRSQTDPMQSDMRSRDTTWSGAQLPPQSPRYPPQHGTTYGVRQLSSAMPPSTGNYPGMFSRLVPPHVSQMSPQRQDKPVFYSPHAKLQAGPVSGSHVSTKKEVIFPPDCVESTQPYLIKRRKIRHKDIGQVNAWHIMMALKSGLLAESTWALDTLSILLFDDSTVAWFGLQHMPGLIEVLMDHYRHCLVKMFDSDFEDLEISSERKKELEVTHPVTSLMEVNEKDEFEMDEVVADEEEEVDGEEKEDADDKEENKSKVPQGRKCSWKVNYKLPDPKKLKEPDNYTLKTIHGSLVKYEDCSPNEWMLRVKHWDIFQGFDSSMFDWQLGRGDSTGHIQTHLEKKDTLEFLRRCFLRNKSKKVERRCDIQRADSLNDSTTVIPKEEPDLSAEGSPKQLPSLDDQNLADGESKTETSDAGSPKSSTSDAGNAAKSDEAAVKTEPDGSVEASATESSKTADDVAVDKDSSKQEDDIAEEKYSKDTASGNGVKQEQDSTDEESVDKTVTLIQTGRQLETLKRKWIETNVDGEAYQHDELPFILLPEALEEVAKRCFCVSNIIRSLSFIPGNDSELARHSGLMMVLSHILLLHHTHLKRNPEQQRFDREVDLDCGDMFEDGMKEWWWDTLDALRENTLVTLANISGQVSLISYPEEICLPILDGLLHWAVCPSAYAQDPLPTMSPHSVLSPQRLALEALCKLCITDSNVDLLLATPPFSRVVQLLGNLIKLIADRNDQVMREFAIVLLSSLVQGDQSAARVVALHNPSISLLIDFIESAEHQAMQIANTHAHGISRLQENPEMMGTSLDMLRRTALILRALSEVPENRSLFRHHQDRILQLVMSQILDHRVAAILSDVLYNCAEES